jgi:glycosyltransferase involved in cell wall biosynthesis
LTQPSVRTVLVNAGPWIEVPPAAYGGIENVIATLVPALRTAGVRVVVATVGSSSLEADDHIATFPTGRFGELARPYNEAAGIAHTHMQRLTVALAGRDDIDVIHDHLEVVGPAVLAAFGREMPPTLHTLHWDTHRHREFYDAFDGRGRVWLNGVSRAQLDRGGPNVLAQSLGHVHLAAPAVADHPVLRRGDYLLVLGRVCALKGQDVAVRLGRRLGVPVVLAGPVASATKPDDLARALSDPASPLHRNNDVRFFREEVEPHLDGGVRWVGSVGGEEKVDLLRRATALLMPIRWAEPGATAVVEALAVGTPVVGMGLGALPELIDEGSTGWLADTPDQLDALCGRINELDPSACVRSAKARFTPARMAADYLDLYEQCLVRSR